MQWCDENNGNRSLSSHHCELHEWFWSGQWTPKLKQNPKNYSDQNIYHPAQNPDHFYHLYFTGLLQKSGSYVLR